jgi:hypothetical protein
MPRLREGKAMGEAERDQTFANPSPAFTRFDDIPNKSW